MTFATLLYFVKYTRCYPLGKYVTINTKHFIFQYPYQHFKELWLCLTFLWIISKEGNLNAFIPNQTAKRFLSTGYAPVKGPSASVFRIRRSYMGQTKNNGAAEKLVANRNYKSTVFVLHFRSVFWHDSRRKSIRQQSCGHSYPLLCDFL